MKRITLSLAVLMLMAFSLIISPAVMAEGGGGENAAEDPGRAFVPDPYYANNHTNAHTRYSGGTYYLEASTFAYYRFFYSETNFEDFPDTSSHTCLFKTSSIDLQTTSYYQYGNTAGYSAISVLIGPNNTNFLSAYGSHGSNSTNSNNSPCSSIPTVWTSGH